MLPSRSSKGHGGGAPLSHQLGAWWQSSNRSLHHKLIMLTVVVLLLSSLMLMHAIVSNWNASRGNSGGGSSSELTQSNNEIMLSKVSDAPIAATRQKKPGDVNLALLGHASWAMLHTMAALFPEDASLTKQRAMISFLTALGELYPCATCARHFRLFMSQHPLPALGQLHRESLSKWLCAAHNGVNARTDKPLQDCALIADLWPSKLEQDCGCDAEEEPSTVSAAKTKDAAAATSIDPAAAAAAPSFAQSPITDLNALSRAIDAQSARDARGKHKAALIEEEERDKAAAAAEEERRKALERELGAMADPAKLLATRT